MTAFVGNAAIAPLYAGAALRSEQVSQLVLGEAGEILAADREWRRIRTFDGYESWVHAGYGVELEPAAADAWSRETLGWSQGAIARIGDARAQLPLRARVALENGTVRLPDGRRGRVVEGTVVPATEAGPAARAKAPERWAIEHFAGAPYQWGGVTPCGVDCSGLVQTTFLARGLTLPRDSSAQVECGVAVPLEDVRPGDLLFFRNDGGAITHVAFAGEADTLVHSTVTCGGVVQEGWLPGMRAAALRERLVAARRLEAR